MAMQMVSFRCDDELKARVADLAQAHGVDTSQMIRSILSHAICPELSAMQPFGAPICSGEPVGDEEEGA